MGYDESIASNIATPENKEEKVTKDNSINLEAEVEKVLEGGEVIKKSFIAKKFIE